MQTQTLRLINNLAKDAVFNMACDRFLYERAITKAEKGVTVRFYRFSEPAFTVGYGMWDQAKKSLQKHLPADNRVVRRVTGGGLVAHDTDLSYSVIAPVCIHTSLGSAVSSYLLIHHALVAALESLGVKADLSEACLPQEGLYCFENPVKHDVLLREKKIAGGAQKRSRGYLLHQGSIAWQEVKSGQPIDEQMFKTAFTSLLADHFKTDIYEQALSPEEIHLVSDDASQIECQQESSLEMVAS